MVPTRVVPSFIRVAAIDEDDDGTRSAHSFQQHYERQRFSKTGDWPGSTENLRSTAQVAGKRLDKVAITVRLGHQHQCD